MKRDEIINTKRWSHKALQCMKQSSMLKEAVESKKQKYKRQKHNIKVANVRMTVKIEA